MSSGNYAANLPTFSGYGMNYGAVPSSNNVPYYSAPKTSIFPITNVQATAPVQLDQQTSAEIESRLTHLGQRRAPLLHRQIVKVPGSAGKVQQVVRRLQTPPPDVIEKIIVTKPQSG